MDTVMLWTGAVLALIYGVLTTFAGTGQIRSKKIQPWAAIGMLLTGLLVVVCGIFVLLERDKALIGLGIGLIGIQILAINNGIKMFGRINPIHHLVRLSLSIAIFALTYLGLK